MNRSIPTFIAFVLTCSIFVSCKKTDSDTGTGGTGGTGGTAGTVLPATPVTASLTGLIVDENNYPLSGVDIRTGSSTAVTNSTGNFTLNNITLDKHKSLVTASHSAYFKGYRIFSASADGTNFIKIKLIKRSPIAVLNGNTGGSVSAEGASIVFGANSFSNAATGAAYTGKVYVYAKVIDPSQSDIVSTIPGGLIGLDSNNKNVCLQSFGMMAVDLEGSSGQKLQISSGKKATITYPIVSSYLAAAPASISLWYVDETTGIWKQEGAAVKSGSNYTGAVSHFSFWNWDIGFSEFVTLDMTLKNNTGEPLANTLVKINLVSQSGTPFVSVGAYTDSKGNVGGYVPANVNLSMEVISDCHTAVHTRSLGTFTQNTSLGDVSIDLGANQIVLAGTVRSCSNATVPNCQLSIFFENKIILTTADANGNFHLAFTKCSGPGYTIIAKDAANGQVSVPYYYQANSAGNNNLQLKACTYQTIPFFVSTLAGGGGVANALSGFADGVGTAARFSDPHGLATDASGNVYVADAFNRRIRKITPAGVVTTIAGSGVQGFADGPAATAQFNTPTGICVANDGTIYVNDYGNFRIRKISNGIVSTFMGTGIPGDLDGPAGTGTISGGNMVMDANGNMFFAQGTKVRKVSPSGAVSTYAGTGLIGYADGPVATAQFGDASQIAIDSLNNIYVTEHASGRVRKISSNGMVSTLAGLVPGGPQEGIPEGGFGIYASLNHPTGITVGPGGFIYILETNGLPRVKKITPEGYVTTIAGNGNVGLVNGPGLSAEFSDGRGIVADKFGNLYLTDGINNCIRKIYP